MVQLSEQEDSSSVIVIMGATGTGKSTFINLLTSDDNIRVGHKQESETFGVQSARYIDPNTGRPVTVVDTPGFDDSREGVTDTDILEKIVRFFEPQTGERINVNGIIYMHRISDPRVGGGSRKNIKLFRALCGDANFGNVRIVTTNWSRVTKEEGDHREADLKSGAFKTLIDGGGQMLRHADTLESARQITSELVLLKPVVMKIQEEVRAGKKLSDTAAGMVLTAEMREAQKKHEQELADLKREMNDAEENENRALKAELEQERKALEDRMERANADRKRLEATVDAARVILAVEPEKIVPLHEQNAEVSKVSAALQARHEHSILDVTRVGLAEERGGKSERIVGSRGQNEVYKASTALQARREDSTKLERQLVVPLESKSKSRVTTYPTQELDTVEVDEGDQIQVLEEELVRGRRAWHQQVESNRARMQASREADLQLQTVEAHLRELESRIKAEERRRRERAQRSVVKQVADGFNYVAQTLTGSGSRR